MTDILALKKMKKSTLIFHFFNQTVVLTYAPLGLIFEKIRQVTVKSEKWENGVHPTQKLLLG